MSIELTNDDLNISYVNGYYDGPISGVCEWNGSRYYFDMLEENDWEENDDPDWYRKYGLYELTDEQWEYEDYKHDQFVKHVGNHFDYEGNRRSFKVLRPQSEWRKFYDQKFEPTKPQGEPVAIWIR